MSDVPGNEEREALIAGDRAGALEPDEAAELPLLADLLADPSTWAEPSTGLEDMIVGAVTAAEPDTTPSVTPLAAGARRATAAPRRRRGIATLVAAAAAIVIVVATVLVTRGGTGPDYEAQLAATALGTRGARVSRHLPHRRRVPGHARSARPPAPAGRRVLPGVVEERGRHPGADRLVQLQRRHRHAVVGCVTRKLPDHHRDDRIDGQRPGVVGSPRARRSSTRRLTPRPGSTRPLRAPLRRSPRTDVARAT